MSKNQEYECEYIHKDRKIRRALCLESLGNKLNKIDSRKYVIIQTNEE